MLTCSAEPSMALGWAIPLICGGGGPRGRSCAPPARPPSPTHPRFSARAPTQAPAPATASALCPGHKPRLRLERDVTRLSPRQTSVRGGSGHGPVKSPLDPSRDSPVPLNSVPGHHQRRAPGARLRDRGSSCGRVCSGPSGTLMALEGLRGGGVWALGLAEPGLPRGA